MTSEQSVMAMSWLKEKVFPLWMSHGIDLRSGAFVESLSIEGLPLNLPRRALVQARQIFSFIEAQRLGIIDLVKLKPLIEKSTAAFIKTYALPSGAFIHSVDDRQKAVNRDVDLYTQSFALFGLAQSYEILRDEKIKAAALSVLNYLYRERAHTSGGFSEIKNSEKLFQSNPHMHLFEAAISWALIDQDLRWRKLADELYQLCLTKFIDTETGFLVEHFNQDWQPLRENENFIFEPGHHYEWAWLFVQYKKLTGLEIGQPPKKLFDLAERFGLDAEKKLAYDEIWSDRTVKKRSSRFWPQCERIKAAVVMNEPSVAKVAMNALFQNFLERDSGLWRDTLLANDELDSGPVKASSLYHIIYAISEFQR